MAAPGKTTTARFPVTFRPRANGIGSGLRTDLVHHKGHPIKARCGSCHAGKAPKRSRRTGGSLKIFHSGLKMRHGKPSCRTCHNDRNYDTLRLADDTEVPFDSLMSLCAQCHGTQKHDYDHGSHGGMSGYWDLTRGPRVRNQCVHCHDPHAPVYVGVAPAPGPQDRRRCARHRRPVDPRRQVRLHAQPQRLHRLSQMRRGVPRGEQPR